VSNFRKRCDIDVWCQLEANINWDQNAICNVITDVTQPVQVEMTSHILRYNISLSRRRISRQIIPRILSDEGHLTQWLAWD